MKRSEVQFQVEVMWKCEKYGIPYCTLPASILVSNRIFSVKAMSLLRNSLVSSPLRRVLDDFLSEADLDLLPAAPRLMLSSPDNGFIRLDAYETETGFHIQCDCAGVPKENICCTIENNILTVKATKSKWYE